MPIDTGLDVGSIAAGGGGDPRILGVGLASIAALSIASTSLGIRLGTERGRAADALVVVLLCNLAIILPLTAVLYYPDYGITARSAAAFAAAGVTGTLLGRVLYFTSISRLGSSRTEPMKSTQTLHATLISVVVLSETVTSLHLAGILLIVGGVAAITWETTRDDPQDLPPRETVRGLLIALGAGFFFGLEPIWAKLGFAEGGPLLVGLSVRMIAAAIGFFSYLWIRGALPSAAALVRTDARWYVVAGVANTLFLGSYYAALQVAPVTVVLPIVQTSPLVVIVLSFLFLPVRLERITGKLLIGAGIVVVGTVMVTFYS